MHAFVPYEKLSKKQQKEINRKKRATWGTVNPVTRKVENAKAYNRKKHQRRMDEDGAGAFLMRMETNAA